MAEVVTTEAFMNTSLITYEYSWNTALTQPAQYVKNSQKIEITDA